MKVILDIRDDKADFFMEVVKNFSFVKAKALTPYREQILENLSDAVQEINLIKSGQKKSLALKDFLNEL